MEQATRSNYQFMNVKELINTAFGDLNANTVNFRLVQTILYLLARQVKLLERRVEVNVPYGLVERRSSTFKVTEVKIKTKKPKKYEKGKSQESVDGQSTGETVGDKVGSIKTGKTNDGTSGKRSSTTTGIGTTSNKAGSRKPLSKEPTLDDIVDMREKVLRVIHQRVDSYEQPAETPSPMASVNTIDAQYEKLLVVERVPSDEGDTTDDFPVIPVVTQEEFLKLANIVEQLQSRFGRIGGAEFPDNVQLMAELRKKSSLTDAMAALQLSARLEATEKALERMIGIITAVIKNTRGDQIADLDNIEVVLGIQSKDGQTHAKSDESTGSSDHSLDEPTLMIERSISDITKDKQKADHGPPVLDLDNPPADYVTFPELQGHLDGLYQDILKQVKDITAQTSATADQAYKLATLLHTKMDNSINVGPRMTAVENLVTAYADQINILDTGLTSQMTNYQEQLTQMQHELEVGVEAMNEALINAQGGDAVVVAELNTNFINLQMDYETMLLRQKNLQHLQEALSSDLTNLWKQIEILRDTKADRDEVADALRDKAGIKDLNGIVSLEQFNAVRGDLEKRIAAAYDKFNNQEIVWQKAIDDLLRELNEKADTMQVTFLKEEINKYLHSLKERLKVIADIVGEPKSAIVTRMLFRDTECICCSSPATMDLEVAAQPPALPKVTSKKTRDGEEGTETDKDETKPKGDGDHRKCYPGLPVPHPIDPRAHFCRRYCGGSHTLITTAPPKTQAEMSIVPLNKKGLKIEETRIPCLPCKETFQPDELLTDVKTKRNGK